MQIEFKKTLAMTLAEVLLVLTIMGVVTALTLPGLKKYSQKTEYAKLAQVGYLALDNGLDVAFTESGLTQEVWLRKKPAELLGTYVAKHLSYSTSASMQSYKKFKDSTNISVSADGFILHSGVMIAGSKSAASLRGGYRFYIDVNNNDPPNMEGVDVFIFRYGLADANCGTTSTNKALKLCPVEHAEDLITDGWRITYW